MAGKFKTIAVLLNKFDSGKLSEKDLSQHLETYQEIVKEKFPQRY